MTPATFYGDYKIDPTNKKEAFNIADYIAANWKRVWTLAEHPMPNLRIVNDPGLPPPVFYGGMTVARDGYNYKVTLNTYDLIEDCHHFESIGDGKIPVLWSGPCTIARHILLLRASIQHKSILKKDNALRCGLDPRYLLWCDAHAEKVDPRKIDCGIIQGAIYDYMKNLGTGERPWDYMRKILRARDEDLRPGFFQ